MPGEPVAHGRRSIARVTIVVRTHLAQREAGVAGGGKQAGDVAMRADADAGRRIVLGNLREQEQHQQMLDPWR